MKNVTILGSTGSIGVNTLDVISRHPDRFRVFALSAQSRVDLLAQQCVQFQPTFAVIAPSCAGELESQLRAVGSKTQVLAGEDALSRIAAHGEVDAVMAAIVGAAGLAPTLAAARAGKTVLLANKEALVMAGQLFMDAIRDGGATLLPIDSEHNAIFQSLPRDYASGLARVGVKRVILTASGGPFRLRALNDLHNVTPQEACAHPNWVMGRKISVDSATMMNKGLEVIEARWLFDASPDKIDVLIHPQSVIHSMVEYSDGSVISQMGNPDMRTPIAYGLGFPERIDAGVASLDLTKVAKLEFAALDRERFACVQLAYDALNAGGTAPATLNAANEIAVEAFLAGALPFLAIPRVIRQTMDAAAVGQADSLDQILRADANARKRARDFVVASVVSAQTA